MAKVTMPQLGESVAEGTIGRWLKKPGDRVEKYEPIVEVVTDKVNAEVPSPFAGILTAILAEEGATVPNNAEIAEIDTADAPSTAASSAPAAATPAPAPVAPAAPAAAEPALALVAPDEPAPARPGPAPAATLAAPAATLAASAPAALAVGQPDARMTPAVRRLLREHETLVGAGPRHRWRRSDHPRRCARPGRGDAHRGIA